MTKKLPKSIPQNLTVKKPFNICTYIPPNIPNANIYPKNEHKKTQNLPKDTPKPPLTVTLRIPQNKPQMLP
jgi:hypothetical protein